MDETSSTVSELWISDNFSNFTMIHDCDDEIDGLNDFGFAAEKTQIMLFQNLNFLEEH